MRLQLILFNNNYEDRRPNSVEFSNSSQTKHIEKKFSQMENYSYILNSSIKSVINYSALPLQLQLVFYILAR